MPNYHQLSGIKKVPGRLSRDQKITIKLLLVLNINRLWFEAQDGLP
jgi:hypothetical protein